MLVLRKPYLLYLGDAVLKSDCKTAFGLRDWSGQDVIGEWSAPGGRVSLDIPRLSPAEAAARGARVPHAVPRRRTSDSGRELPQAPVPGADPDETGRAAARPPGFDARQRARIVDHPGDTLRSDAPRPARRISLELFEKKVLPRLRG